MSDPQTTVQKIELRAQMAALLMRKTMHLSTNQIVEGAGIAVAAMVSGASSGSWLLLWSGVAIAAGLILYVRNRQR